jgi:hypothetical protein
LNDDDVMDFFGHGKPPTLGRILNHEVCPGCGERGFDQGESIPNPYGWEAISATCRNCGMVIEKRRFSSR